MISIIFSFIPIILIVIWMAFSTKRNSLSWEIKKGYNCYNCKSVIQLTVDETNKRLFNDDEQIQLCTTCNRDRKIKSINNKFIHKFYKFQNWLVSKKSDKMFVWFITPISIFLILGVILSNRYISCISSTLNSIYLIIQIYKTYYTSQKKIKNLS